MKSMIFISLVLSVFENPFQSDKKWLSYKEQFNKTYLNKYEEIQRYNNFKANDEEIMTHNARYLKGEVKYRMGLNELSDMSKQEFRDIYLKPFKVDEIVSHRPLHLHNVNAPDSLSYQKYCLSILNQQQCGSCWAFASCAQVEIQMKRKTGDFDTHISPQYVLDCGNAGSCDGGYADKALAFLKSNGLVSLTDYPYHAQQGQCNNGVSKMSERIKSSDSKELNGDEEGMKNLLATVGPVVTLIQATSKLQHYHSGIFSEDDCPNECDQINHAVALIGYGGDGDDEFWTIRNSWGPGWGENGYFRMSRNNDNTCNVACFAFYSEV